MSGPIIVAEIPEQYRTNPSLTGPTQIYDYLFLGTWRNSHEIQKLRKLGITGIINCASDYKIIDALYSNRDRKTQIDMDFLLLNLKEDSSVLYNFNTELDRAVAFIKKHHLEKGKVLIHCSDGVCRSPAIALGFIMKEEGIDFGKAIAKFRTLPGNPLVVLNSWLKEALDENFDEMSKFA